MGKITAHYILSFTIMFLSGCSQYSELETKDKSGVTLSITTKVITIDKCEYIVVQNGNATWGAHKGNCKNHIKEDVHL